MNKIEELEKLLKTDVLVEVNEEIQALDKLISKNKDNEDYSMHTKETLRWWYKSNKI